jgi:hypothetical protein
MVAPVNAQVPTAVNGADEDAAAKLDDAYHVQPQEPAAVGGH